MNPIYFFLILPLIAPILVLYFTKRNIKDNLLPIIGFSLAGALVLGLSLMAINGYASRDTETLNGFVTTKEINRFTCPVNTGNPCENGFDCHCHTVTYSCGSDDKGNTKYCSREECDRCYEYAWEQNFFVASSLQGDRAYKIARIDEQGSKTPPRWAAIRHGDPVSITNSYTNYILAASDSLFSEDGAAEEKYKSKIPAYPQSIFDYYRVNRLVTGGNVKLDAAVWNEQISRILVQVGPRKQANVVVVVAEGIGMDYVNAVRRAWRGFKKNDIVVFAGVDVAGNMVWTRTLSWSKDSMVNITIESDILARFQGKPLEPIAFTQIVKTDSLAHFSRRSMEDFAYLKDEASLSSTQMVWIWILSILIGAGSVFGSLGFLDALPRHVARTASYMRQPLRRFRP